MYTTFKQMHVEGREMKSSV